MKTRDIGSLLHHHGWEAPPVRYVLATSVTAIVTSIFRSAYIPRCGWRNQDPNAGWCLASRATNWQGGDRCGVSRVLHTYLHVGNTAASVSGDGRVLCYNTTVSYRCVFTCCSRIEKVIVSEHTCIGYALCILLSTLDYVPGNDFLYQDKA